MALFLQVKAIITLEFESALRSRERAQGLWAAAAEQSPLSSFPCLGMWPHICTALYLQFLDLSAVAPESVFPG